jgi:hypothetical protein
VKVVSRSILFVLPIDSARLEIRLDGDLYS